MSSYGSHTSHDPNAHYPPPPQQHDSYHGYATPSGAPGSGAMIPHPDTVRGRSRSYSGQHLQVQPAQQPQYYQPQQPAYSRHASHQSHRSHHSYHDSDRDDDGKEAERRYRRDRELEHRGSMGESIMKTWYWFKDLLSSNRT